MSGPPIVLIGPVSDDHAESVSSVNKAFIQDLSNRYRFVPHVSNRAFGATQQSGLNALNALYFVKHLAVWIYHLLRHRPHIAHYALNSGWAMEKGLFFLKLGRVCGAKTLAHLHSGSFLDFWAALPERRKRRALRELRSLDGLIVLSEEWKTLVGDTLGLSSSSIHVVNNPIDKVFESEALQMPTVRQGMTVLSLGVMHRQKGVLDIVDAATRLKSTPPCTFRLVGPDRERGIRSDVLDAVNTRGLGGSIEVMPAVLGRDKIELFRNATIFLLPSYYENFPLVILEAAAAGLPIITTPVGATTEFFRDGESALFVQPGNPAQLAEALDTLIAQPAYRHRLGQNARKVFLTCLRRDKIMADLGRIYQRLMGEIPGYPCGLEANVQEPD